MFNFQDDPDGNALLPITVSFDPDAFFLTNQPLDFTLIAVAPPETEGTVDFEQIGWSRLIEGEGKVINGEYVTIVQHPNGQPKQISLRENQIIDVLENFLHYHTDTAPGSSGSPLFNDQWEVVGLHHSGVPKRDTQGRILTRDNTLWTAALGDGAIQWIANEGVRISRILNHVKSQSLRGEARRLRDQIFEAMPTVPDTTSLSMPGGGSVSFCGRRSITITHGSALGCDGAEGDLDDPAADHDRSRRVLATSECRTTCEGGNQRTSTESTDPTGCRDHTDGCRHDGCHSNSTSSRKQAVL
ncbi:MAG: trypsin-like peptidase domain-containing protein [Nitrospira sp.]